MVNKVILIGNVGADPEVGHLESGISVAKLSLATTEYHKNKNGERVSQTEWHNIVLWRGLADIAEKYVKKGMRLYIEGRLRTRVWEDQNGSKRYITEIYADSITMLSSKVENKPQLPTQSYGTPYNPTIQPLESGGDDLPF